MLGEHFATFASTGQRAQVLDGMEVALPSAHVRAVSLSLSLLATVALVLRPVRP